MLSCRRPAQRPSGWPKAATATMASRPSQSWQSSRRAQFPGSWLSHRRVCYEHLTVDFRQGYTFKCCARLTSEW